PAARQETEEGEESTYSSDRGMERAAAGGDRGGEDRKRRPRRRRAKPEAIAARLRSGAEGEGGEPAEGAAEGAAEGGEESAE
ncbi:MAG: hypothetical protein ACJ79S_16630, partial [Gemmatimonadaceae bacterium]